MVFNMSSATGGFLSFFPLYDVAEMT